MHGLVCLQGCLVYSPITVQLNECRLGSVRIMLAKFIYVT